MSDPYGKVTIQTTKGNDMDEFDFGYDEDCYDTWTDEDYLAEEEEFTAYVDHDAGFEQDEQSFYAEAMLAYYD
jgi:hypothetical protein